MAEAHGAQAELDYRKGYPASINDAGLVKQTLGTLEKVLGSKNVVEVQPSMGGEDFAYFAQKIPGFYLSLGVTRPGTEKPAGLHTPEFEVDENALLTGLRVMTALAWDSITQAPSAARK